MARCDQGYLCDVCGDEVENIRESDLYLRFVIGEIAAKSLLAAPERHLRCNPVYSQQRAELVTRGWLRLQELFELAQTIPLPEYPLPEFRQRV
jgi:hypothetical protein